MLFLFYATLIWLFYHKVKIWICTTIECRTFKVGKKIVQICHACALTIAIIILVRVVDLNMAWLFWACTSLVRFNKSGTVVHNKTHFLMGKAVTQPVREEHFPNYSPTTFILSTMPALFSHHTCQVYTPNHLALQKSLKKICSILVLCASLLNTWLNNLSVLMQYDCRHGSVAHNCNCFAFLVKFVQIVFQCWLQLQLIIHTQVFFFSPI